VFDTREFGSRGEGWVAAQLTTVALLLFPPGVLRTLVNDSGVALMVLGVVLMCAVNPPACYRCDQSRCRLCLPSPPLSPLPLTWVPAPQSGRRG